LAFGLGLGTAKETADRPEVPDLLFLRDDGIVIIVLNEVRNSGAAIEGQDDAIER
jgi:hypothetical protein